MNTVLKEEYKDKIITITEPIPFKITKIDGKEINFAYGITECLSKEGMLFTADRNFSISKILEVEFDLKNLSEKILCLVKVIQIEVDENGMIRISADFYNISDKNKMLIRQVINGN